MLQRLDVKDVNNALKQGSSLYIGAISFEARTTGWINHLLLAGLKPTRSVVFDYDTQAEPLEDDRELRLQSESVFRAHLGTADLQFIKNVNAFAVNSLEVQTRNALLAGAESVCIIDFTCMTRVHLFAAIRAAISARDLGRKVFFCYAAAQGYGFSKADFHGWRDVLFVSVTTGGLADSNARAYGIISAGHDGERLGVALQESEPPSGIMIYAKNSQRPDFTSRALAANSVVHTRLESLRSPRQNHGPMIDDRWTFAQIEVDDLADLSAAVLRQIGFARSAQGAIAVFPFGPKPMTLCIADAIQSGSDVPAWMVYPVPNRFSVNYSAGTGSLSAYIFS